MNRVSRGQQCNPLPEEIKAARAATGLTQPDAADVIYSTVRTWQDWESGQRRMHPGLFELFVLKTTPAKSQCTALPRTMPKKALPKKRFRVEMLNLGKFFQIT